MRLSGLVLAFLIVTPAAAQSDPNLLLIPGNDPQMKIAVAKARTSLPDFLEQSRHPKPKQEAFAVKVGLGPTKTEEFFWVSPFQVEGDTLTGQLANEPEVVQGYHKGETIKVPLSQISDWMYFEDGKMRGNYTACVLFAHESKEALADYEKTYGADCSKM